MGIVSTIDITAEQKKLICDLIIRFLPNTTVWAFGSRVKYTAKTSSDLDLVAFSNPEQKTKLALLREAFEESNLPFRVDILDWYSIPENFKTNISDSYYIMIDAAEIKIPNNWKKYKFDDVAELKHGFQFRTDDFTEKGIKIFKITQIQDNGQINISGCDFIDEKRLNDFEKFRLNKGDILMALTGATIGKLARYNEDEICLQNYRVGNFLIKDENILSKDYFYYFLSSKYFFNQILARQTQSAQQNIGKDEINKMLLFIPPFATQKVIGSTLTSLDDKIELNRQLNQTLEEIAQSIFKEWFVNFNFPGATGEMQDSELGEIPKGWRVGKLSEVLEIKYGKDHKHLENGHIPVYGSGGIMRFVNKSIYDKESILIPRKGTLSNLYYVNKPFWSVDTMFYTKIGDEIYTKYLFILLMSMNLASMNVGSAVPSLTTEILNNLELVVPSKEVMKSFDNLVSKFFEMKDTIELENKYLSQIRDALLPRLMNGEINV
jgi:type I restriction enzyme S subunit